MDETAASRLQYLLDKDEIRDRVYTFSRGVDRCDWGLVRSVYHPDAFDDHGPYQGDIDGMLAWLQGRHSTVATSMHVVGNVLIAFDGDIAHVESYFLVFQRVDGASEATEQMFPSAGQDPTGVDVRIQGRYINRFERREPGGPWPIARRIVVADAAQFESPTNELSLESGWNVARRDRQDRVYSGG